MITKTRSHIETEEYWENLIKKSVSRYFLLGMLAERPMHGYELAASIESCCEGWSKPTSGMIYPTIKEMTESGHIKCREGSNRGAAQKGMRAYGIWQRGLQDRSRSLGSATALSGAIGQERGHRN